MSPYAHERSGTGNELPVAASHMESGHSSVSLQIRLKQLVGLRHIKKAELFSTDLLPVMIYFRPAERTGAIKIHGQARSFRRHDRPSVSARWLRLELPRPKRQPPFVASPAANSQRNVARGVPLQGHHGNGEARRKMTVRKLRYGPGIALRASPSD